MLQLAAAVSYCGLIFAFSARSDLAPPDLGFRISDKALHAAEYFVFGVLWYGVFRSFGWSFRGWSPGRMTWVFGALFAASDEIHQAFVPVRQCDFWDWVADVIGLALAVAALRGLERLWRGVSC